MPITRVLGSESALNSTRSAIVRPCPNQARPHANLPAPRVHRPHIPSSFVKQIRRPQARQHNKGGRVGGVRCVSLRPSTALARERGLHELVRTRSRLTSHRSPNIPSAAAPEPPAVTRHARRPHIVPRLIFPPCSSHSRKPSLPTSSALTHSNSASHCRWRTALAAGQRLGSRAPAARSARTPAVFRRLTHGAAQSPRGEMSPIVSPCSKTWLVRVSEWPAKSLD